MKYYKVIVDSEIIGVGTSLNCLRFQAKNSILERVNDI